MKKNLKYGVAAVALLCAGIAFAQLAPATNKVTSITTTDLFQDIARGVPSTTNLYATSLQLRSWIFSQNSQHLATAPTIGGTTCGGTTSASISGTDFAGQVTVGQNASTSCILSFATVYATAPACFVSINNVADNALKCATTTATVTITYTSTTGALVNYLILGLSGG